MLWGRPSDDITFCDGAPRVGERPFDVVVAADGVGSAVRRAVFGEAGLRELGLVMVGFDLPATALAGPMCRVTEVGSPVGHFGVYPYPGGFAVDFAFPHAGRIDGDGAAREQLSARFKHLEHPVLRQVLALIPRAQRAFAGSLRSVSLRRWYTGRTMLVGDAAHAILPTAGIGASLALCDAVSLVSALAGEHDLESAARRYHRERWGPARDVQRQGVRLKRMMLLPAPFDWLRDALLSRVSARGYASRLAGL
ncbi:MAG: FAD-dependent monooxygenase [Myxococcaceae bacterium]|nr:FAD-dependent monooxygenase [Myxococcaceae bacterium]MCA3012837.1 FAD-dependent monooxygenase [Myxococcaceae bacterium]